MNKLFLHALLLASLSAQPLLAHAQESGLQWRLSGLDVYYRLPGELTWQHAPGSAIDVADGWVIGTDQVAGGYAIYRWNGYDWDREPGGAVEIGGTYFHPWVINDRGERFNWDGSNWYLEGYGDVHEQRVYIESERPVQIYEDRVYVERAPPVRIYENRAHIDHVLPGQRHDERRDNDVDHRDQDADRRDHDHDTDHRTDTRLNFNNNNTRQENYNRSRDEHEHVDRTRTPSPAVAAPAAPARVTTPVPAQIPHQVPVPVPHPAPVPAPVPHAVPAPVPAPAPAPGQRHDDGDHKHPRDLDAEIRANLPH